GEGDLFQLLAVDGFESPLHGTAAAAPVEVGRHRVLGKRPDDEAFQAPLIEPVAASLEQVLAVTEALVDGSYIELVNFALVGPARAAEAERRVTDDGAALLEHDQAVAAADDARPPIRAAPADHVLKMIVGENAAIGVQP